ncbi:unnamed protein product [Enterobius vermicularis]|uniref:AAA_lid_3 domain-containing protein n=1 Tax=Enterobius vermicularis TaxID=51028 RepID=A0A0N4V951_ENTVE|nr:unnamed protein product [Enterobius vermicularis]
MKHYLCIPNRIIQQSVSDGTTEADVQRACNFFVIRAPTTSTTITDDDDDDDDDNDNDNDNDNCNEQADNQKTNDQDERHSTIGEH